MLRTASGISQKEFARRLDISASYLSLIESNGRELNVNLLRQISRELGVPVSAFFFDAEEAISSASDQQDEWRSVQSQFGQILQRLLAYEKDFAPSSIAKKQDLEADPPASQSADDSKSTPDRK